MALPYIRNPEQQENQLCFIQKPRQRCQNLQQSAMQSGDTSGDTAAIQSLSLARRAAHNQALPPLTYGLLK